MRPVEMGQKSPSIELADTLSDLMSGVAGWLLIGLGIISFLAGTGGIVQTAGTAEVIVPFLLVGFAVLCIISGVFVNPRFRRRLNRRHGLSRFGTVKTVEHRTRSATENGRESCVVCDSDSEEGLIRRYRQEYAVVGVPLWTISENHNFYCPDCALSELSDRSTVGTRNDDTTEWTVTEAE
jgi:membrane protein implicated in regulation of membrane protease activity